MQVWHCSHASISKHGILLQAYHQVICYNIAVLQSQTCTRKAKIETIVMEYLCVRKCDGRNWWSILSL